MNTKILMTASAITNAFIGLVCSFMPQEILAQIGVNESQLFSIIIQLMGALYLGFAILNWTAKANLIGGIYSKPVAIGNFMHYIVGALTLIKYFITHQDMTLIIIPTIIYAIFALLFGKVVFGSPI